MRNSRVLRWCCCLAVTAVGCDDGNADVGRATSEVRDSAGIRIVENRAMPDAPPVLELSAQAITQIGTLEGPPESQLFRVMSAVRLSDGRVAVANMGSNEIRIYDDAGRHLVSAGREGDGPGEFRAIAYLRALAGDTLLVYDFANARVSLYASDGTHVRDYLPPLPQGQSLQRVMAALADSTLLTLGHADPPTRSSELGRDSVPFLIIEPSGPIHDTHVYPGADRRIRVYEDGGRITNIMVEGVPFSRAVHAASSDDAFFLAANQTWEVHRYGSDGRLQTIVRRADVQPRPVTDALLEEQAEWEIAQNTAGAGSAPPGSGTDPQSIRQRMLSAARVDALPMFEGIAVADDGSFWVREYVPPAAAGADVQWSVFDPDGRMIGTLQAPADFTPMHITSETVTGVARDELEVEYVRVYGISRPSA